MIARRWTGRCTVALAVAGFVATPFAAERAASPFGMRLRAPPARMDAVWAPAIVREAPTNECSLVARHDGTLELYGITKPASDSVSVIRSRDGGLTWSAADVAFPLPGKAYYAVMVLEAADGALHAVFHLLGEGPGGYRGRLYEVYHTWRPAGAAAWSPPRRVVPGYVGSINGFVQLARSGRLVLAVARAVPEREKPPASGPDRGWHDTFVYTSDDQGTTWRESPDRLSLVLAGPNATRYGAIEPALLELRDGRVWMLVRDRGGRLWQTFSADGAKWPALERSPFISSDSPADLLRLRDGRIVLFTNACQNGANPRSYAMGGREVLHAAISRDEGRTWRGFREVLQEPPVETRGDRGSSYASPVQNTSGKIVVASGQGEGKRAILLFDPDWLEESPVHDDLDPGPVAWTQYGSGGLRVEPQPEGTAALVIPARDGGGGALWNFPSADAGEVAFRLRVPADAADVRLALTDHFSRIDDPTTADRAVYSVRLDAAEAGAAERWRTVRLAWRGAASGAGRLVMAVDGREFAPVGAQRAGQFGVNYLRLEFRAVAGAPEVRLAGATMRRD